MELLATERLALPQLEPDPVVISWWSYSTALWYAQCVDGQRPDVAIIDDRTRLDENLGAANIQLTAADLREIDRAASQIEVQGARYPEALLKMVGR